MRAIDLRDVDTVVLDEADQMADMGFLPTVRRIDERPERRQMLLFSATLDGPVAKLVAISSTTRSAKSVRRAPTCTPPSITSGWSTAGARRDHRRRHPRLGSTIVFTRTRHGADRLAKQLGRTA